MFGEADMQGLLQQAQAMQAQMAKAQAELSATEVTGNAGGGVVSATVNGAMELLSLELDPSVVDPEDTESLADLIVAAVRDAHHNARALAESKLGGVAGGMPNIPGLPGFGG